MPGSGWLYLKFYVSRSFADKILTHELYNTIKQLKRKGYLSGFFFIRYTDPYYHLRLRIRLTDTDHYSPVLSAFHGKLQKYTESGLVWKIQLDTYYREIERYNIHLMETTESLFQVDSRYTIEMLQLIGRYGNEDHKWKIGLKNIDAYLHLFDARAADRMALIRSMSDAFRLEYHFNPKNMRVLNDSYRKKRKVVENILQGIDEDPLMQQLFMLQKKRDKQLSGIVCTLKALCSQYGLDHKDYIGSYIHMHINRLIPANNRLHELLLYDYVRRFYESMLARDIHASRSASPVHPAAIS
ncbi:thiopeptide-type bacteriocin biosynthesis protein [Taibaiella helva]|uniref:thiopeptide-type bacteriocin biosynthesis protein n=1 Tax=Taibaiella helva TaxID=2301235 RepID=UPI0021D0F5A2|nr:thiopeptide-type bacteriocin biosynthesis protein [Taibaiella helva]